MAKFYVYTLAYPPELEGGRVFYVGKGCAGRLDQHEHQAAQGYEGPRYDAIRAVWAAGYQIIKAKVFETDDHAEVFAHEKQLINQYGLANLTNLKPGGEFRRPLTRPKWLVHRVSLPLVVNAKLDQLIEMSQLNASNVIAILINKADPADFG